MREDEIHPRRKHSDQQKTPRSWEEHLFEKREVTKLDEMGGRDKLGNFLSEITASHCDSDDGQSSSSHLSAEFDPAQLAALTLDDIATTILRSPYSERKQFVLNNLDSDSKTIHSKVYPLPINWGGLGTRLSYLPNPEKYIPYIADSMFDHYEEAGSCGYISFHTHFEYTKKEAKHYPLVQELVKRYGTPTAYALATIGDLAKSDASRSWNNLWSQIYLGKDINAYEAGMGIVFIGLEGKAQGMGMLDIYAMAEDDRSADTILDFLDRKFDFENERGKKYIPYVDEVLPVLDAVRKHTLVNEMPDWIDQKSNLSFTDMTLTSMGGHDKIMGIFQEEINELPGFEWLGESEMYGISTQNRDKIDTLVKQIRPIIKIPRADKDLIRITSPGIPVIKLGADKESRELFLEIRSNREAQIPEEGCFKTGQAVISVKEVLFVDKGWEHYLPKELLEAAIK